LAGGRVFETGRKKSKKVLQKYVSPKNKDPRKEASREEDNLKRREIKKETVLDVSTHGLVFSNGRCLQRAQLRAIDGSLKRQVRSWKKS